MKPRTIAAAVLALILAALPVRGQQEGGVLSLSLEECILRAMKKNLSVAIQVLNPEIAGAALTQAGEKYYPTLSLAYNKRNTDSASFSWLDAADSVVTRSNDYSLDLNQVLPGGGTVGVSLASNMNDSNRSFQTINPRYGSTLTFDFSQPLLKDFGWNISRREILLARNNLSISENDLETALMSTIYQVEVRLLDARLRHRQPRGPAPVPPAGPGPPGEESPVGRGRRTGPHRDPQRPGRSRDAGGRHPSGRSPGQECRGPDEGAPQPLPGRGQGRRLHHSQGPAGRPRGARSAWTRRWPWRSRTGPT